MQIGERWAYREPPQTPGKAAIPVDVLQLGPPRRQVARVRFLAGAYPGLDQWVAKKRLLAPWAEIEAFLKDEVRFAAVCAASVDVVDPTAEHAAAIVFGCYPVPNAIVTGCTRTDCGVLTIDDLDAAC